jgi:hypothetical protein
MILNGWAKKMNLCMKSTLILALAVVSGSVHSARGDEPEIQKPSAIVEVFSFGYFIDDAPPRTRLFTFERGEEGYSLKWIADGNYLCQKVNYVKTFGGRFPSVSVHLINSRFIVYPETLQGTEIPDTTFHDMKAVTHVYDVERQKVLYSSKPYQYNHDAPLNYDLSSVLGLAWMADQPEHRNAQQ